MLSTILCGLAALSCVFAQRPLESYNVDLSGISVSGLSAGGAMATQFHVAYSSIFMGMGSLAGVLYYCGEGNTVRALQCMEDTDVDPGFLANEARRFESEAKIDALTNLYDSRVVILQGELDTTVVPACAASMKEFYLEFTDPANIIELSLADLVHGFPTEDYGTACSVANRDEYINDCDYHGAYEVLDAIYGGLERPTSSTPTPGDFYEFDQEEFCPAGCGSGGMNSISMDSIGYVYVPSACVVGATCRLHLSLHGCNQGRDYLEDSYAWNTFYNQVGELNNIIIFHPQVARSINLPSNPQGCWDWWGYNDGLAEAGDYVTHLGDQHIAVMDMIDRLTGGRLNLNKGHR